MPGKLSNPPRSESAASTIKGTVITFGLSSACSAASWRGLPKKTIQIWRPI